MKLLLVAPASHFTEQMLAALQQLGVKADWINDREWQKYSLLWRLSRRWRWLRNINTAILNKQILRHTPDAVLVNKGIDVMPETLRELRRRGVKTANWFPDNARTEEYGPWLQRMIPEYDVFFSFHSNLPGTDELPVAVDPSFFNLSNLDQRFAHRIVFIGGYFPEREEMLSAIRDFEPVIYGSHGWKTSSFASSYRGMLTPQQFASVYALSDISININTDPPVPGVNLKTFEIPACGGFQLSDYRPGLEKLFEIRKEIAVFRDAQELRSMVQYYVTRPAERHVIAQAGRARVMRNHTMVQRIKTICDKLFSTSGPTATGTRETRS